MNFFTGDWNEEQVLVKQGRFGYYVRCGKVIAGLRKLDPSTLTLEEAIEILVTRGKQVGSKKKKTKKAVQKVKPVKARTRPPSQARSPIDESWSSSPLYYTHDVSCQH